MDKPTVRATIGGVEYPLYLNLYATSEIQEKYGDLKSAAKAAVDSEDYSKAIDAAAEIVVILANQGIAYENYFNKEKREKLTVEAVKIFCTPYEFGEIRGKIIEAMVQGTNQTIKSEAPEDPEKNSPDE